MNIYESICAVMQDVGAVGKNTKNQQQGYMFRGVDAVVNALQPAMIKNKMFVVPEVLEQHREERTSAKGSLLIYSVCKMRYTFYAEDGSNVSAVVIGEGMDSGDKASNKAMAVAFKYACFQTFCIPTEEMRKDDPDNETHEVAKEHDINFLIYSELARTGVGKKQMLESYGVSRLDDMTQEAKQHCLAKLNAMKSKEVNE